MIITIIISCVIIIIVIIIIIKIVGPHLQLLHPERRLRAVARLAGPRAA